MKVQFNNVIVYPNEKWDEVFLILQIVIPCKSALSSQGLKANKGIDSK